MSEPVIGHVETATPRVMIAVDEETFAKLADYRKEIDMLVLGVTFCAITLWFISQRLFDAEERLAVLEGAQRVISK